MNLKQWYDLQVIFLENHKYYTDTSIALRQEKKIENLNELERKEHIIKKAGNEVSQNKLDYIAKKELEKEIRKTSNKIKSTESRIEKLEKDIAVFDNNLQNPDNNQIDLNDSNLFVNYESLKKELDNELRNWEKLSYELEILTDKREDV